MNHRESYEDALSRFSQSPVFEGNNQFLLTLAYKARRAGRTKEEAKVEIWGAYMAQLSGRGEALGTREAEVDRAVEKAYESPLDGSLRFSATAKGRSKKTSLNRSDYQSNISAWRARKDPAKCEWFNAITSYDLRRDRTTCKTALEAIYRHAQKDALIWCGKSDSDTGPNTFFPVEKPYLMQPGTEKISTAVFREAGMGRKTDNIAEICAVLIECDDELATGGRAENPRKTALEDIALIIEALGIRPTTITWSGNKSYHVLFRLSDPISVADFEAEKARLKSAYCRCGLDPAVVTAMRGTRCPRGSTWEDAREGMVQRLVYLDAEAETDFASFCKRISELANEMGGQEKEEVRHAPCPIFDANETKRKKARRAAEANGEEFDGTEIPAAWKVSPLGLESLIDFCGISKMTLGKGECQNQVLMHVDPQNRYKEITVSEAADILDEAVKAEYGAEIAAEFKRICGANLHAASLSAYMGHNAKLNPLRDTASTVYIPYKNGLLKITKDAAELVDYDAEHHINADEPSLKRKWKPELADRPSEFEQFVENLSGKVDDRPDWRERARAFCTLIGYLISRHKDVVNYICIIMDEGLKKNTGGSGKSRLQEAVAQVRCTYYKDFRKDKDTSNRRFYMSDLEIKHEFCWLDDAPEDFDYGELFNMSTGMADIELKGQNKHRKIDFDDLPKLSVSTNFFPKGIGHSFERRMRIWETTGYYRRFALGAFDEFGHRFFSDDCWDEAEWARFDCFMANCVRLFLVKGLCQFEGGQKDEKFLQANFPKEVLSWLNETVLDPGARLPKKDLPKSYKEWYENTHGGFLKSNYNHETLREYLELFCKARNVEIGPDRNLRIGNIQTKCWNFLFDGSGKVAESSRKATESSGGVAPISLQPQVLMTTATLTLNEKDGGEGVYTNVEMYTKGMGEIEGSKVADTANHCCCVAYDATEALPPAISCYRDDFLDDAPDAGRNNIAKPMDGLSENQHPDDRMDFDLSILPGYMLEWRKPSKGSVVDPATNLPMTPDGLVDGLGHFRPSPLDETGTRPADERLMEFLDLIGYGPRWNYIKPAE